MKIITRYNTTVNKVGSALQFLLAATLALDYAAPTIPCRVCVAARAWRCGYMWRGASVGGRASGPPSSSQVNTLLLARQWVALANVM